jgi:peptide-methionine (S)-S-oxide reductase
MTEATERAVLAGGCFWRVQELVRKLPGVISTRVGYTGGNVPNATYRNHGTHAEGIEVVFDPSVTSYRDLLEFFFQIHDPTTKNRQGNDVGPSYRSAIYYTSDEQRTVAEETIADIDASGLWPARSSPRWRRPGPSGRPSRSTRTTCSATRTATRATTSGRTGSYPATSPRRRVVTAAGRTPACGSRGR